MKMTMTMGALVLAVLLAFPAFAMPQVGTGAFMGMGSGMGYGPGMARFGYGPGMGYGPAWGAGLNLSPEQIQKLDTLHANFFKETLPLRNQMTAAHMELRALWAQPNPDQGQIVAKQRQINALREQIQEKATRYRLEARALLTPEQQAQLGPYGLSGLFGGMGMGRGYEMGYGRGPMYGMGYGRGYGMGYGCRSW